jgi:Holliday junction resolvase-like predicted endonuclease
MGEWLEKELEDYIVAHPAELNALIFRSAGYEFTYLGRQVRCQYGIIDALFWARNDYFSYVMVVECKAKHEKGSAVEQLTRYQKAISHADIYNDAPDDAWPINAPDGRGWAWRIELKTIPVLIAPTFSPHLETTFEGVLITAERTQAGFKLTRLVDRLNYDGQEHLNSALFPVIKRAQIDAKTKHIQDSLGQCTPLLYEYSAN